MGLPLGLGRDRHAGGLIVSYRRCSPILFTVQSAGPYLSVVLTARRPGRAHGSRKQPLGLPKHNAQAVSIAASTPSGFPVAHHSSPGWTLSDTRHDLARGRQAGPAQGSGEAEQVGGIRQRGGLDERGALRRQRQPNRHRPTVRARPAANMRPSPHLWSCISRCCFWSSSSSIAESARYLIEWGCPCSS